MGAVLCWYYLQACLVKVQQGTSVLGVEKCLLFTKPWWRRQLGLEVCKEIRFFRRKRHIVTFLGSVFKPSTVETSRGYSVLRESVAGGVLTFLIFSRALLSQTTHQIQLYLKVCSVLLFLLLPCSYKSSVPCMHTHASVPSHITHHRLFQ